MNTLKKDGSISDVRSVSNLTDESKSLAKQILSESNGLPLNTVLTALYLVELSLTNTIVDSEKCQQVL
jgi:hypothetical protein